MTDHTTSQPDAAIASPESQDDLPPVGALMTVQIRDEDGTVHTFHGTRGAVHAVATTRDASLGGQVRWLRIIGAADSPMPGEDPATLAPYLTIHSATGGPFAPGTLPRSGPEHFFAAGAHSLSVLLENADSVTFSAAARVGAQWVQEHLSLGQRRNAFLDRLRNLDDTLAVEAARLFDQVEQQARHRGFAEGMDSAGGL